MQFYERQPLLQKPAVHQIHHHLNPDRNPDHDRGLKQSLTEAQRTRREIQVEPQNPQNIS